MDIFLDLASMVEWCDDNGNTFLHLNDRRPRFNARVALYLKSGCDVHATNNDG